MKDRDKTKDQLSSELVELRQRFAELEAKNKRVVESWRDLWASHEAIVEAFDGLIYICSQKFEVEFMNKLLISHTGHYPLGQKCYKALYNLDDVCSWCVNEQVFRGETVRRDWLSPKDNCWYHIVTTPVQHPDGSLSCMVMMQDITERKQAEECLRRTTRALKTLSESDHILVQATDELHLINEVCRIIVGIGGYRLAWVGLAEQDEEKTVRPVGCAGFEEGYLGSVNISWADTETGQGPTGLAIRMGQTSIVKNMATDPTYAPWREEALRRGYASSIALPLQEKGKVMGALNIYATEPDAFDPDEVKLLEELAFDVAYGIGALRTRAEHDRMEKALREAEEKYHSIFENAVEGIFQSTPEGRLISVNPALAKMHGYGSPEEMIFSIMDLGHQVFVDPNCRAEFKREMEKLGVIRGAEYQVYRKDGSKIWISVNARAVRDEHGAIQYYEGFIQEVTDRKRKKA